MAILFPAIAPVNITVSLGAYSISRAVAPAGSNTIRQRGSEPYGITAFIDFGTIVDDLAADIVIAWYTALSTYKPLLLPSIIWQGIQTNLTELLPLHTQWYFKEPVTYSSSPDLPGYTVISVVLEGEY